ncbi:MAG TPA: NEW3 domain-containing protein, partial [Bacilli bacterium]
MKFWKIAFSLLLALTLGGGTVGGYTALAAGGVELYTPYTNLSVTPGQTVSYSIDVINHSDATQEVPVAVQGLPDGWKSDLSSGGYGIQKIAVQADDSRSINLDIDVPLAVDKGTYTFKVTAGSFGALNLTINVTEQGSYKTELLVNQPNMQGHADSNFNFSADLKNRTASKQDYALSADAPAGWNVEFEDSGKSVTSVSVDENTTHSINIDITPAQNVEAGTYEIPIHAATKSSSADAKLEVVITGTFKLDLSTVNDVLSTNITAGHKKKIDLKLTNQGSAELKNIELTANTPADWEVTFDQTKIASLAPGKSTTVAATVKASSKAIAGDYQLNINANSPEASSTAQFRITVKTSVLWGWIGILLILIVIVVIYYLI